jgi:hypothetical protein
MGKAEAQTVFGSLLLAITAVRPSRHKHRVAPFAEN